MTRRLELRTTMTQERIDRWARLSGDYNPLHVDPEFAADTRFGGTIAHGHIALALFEHLLTAELGERWLEGGELSEVRFKAPVRPGGAYLVFAAPVEGEGLRYELAVEDADGGTCVTGLAYLQDHPGPAGADPATRGGEG